MLQLALYGKPSSRYEYLKLQLSQKLDEYNVDVSLKEVNDVEVFMKENVLSIPAVRLNGDNLFECRNDEDINSFTAKVVEAILKKEAERESVILVPVDFSEPSKNALDFAAKLATRTGSRVKLFHVFHPRPVEVNGTIWINPEAADAYCQKLEKIAEPLKEAYPKVSFDHQVMEGFPVESITETSSLPEIKYVVMGTTGENSALKKWMGSVSHQVAKKCDCPIFVIPPEVQCDIKSILFASDDPVLDVHGLRIVLRMAETLNADVKVVHVKKPGDEEKEGWLSELNKLFPGEDLEVTSTQHEDVVMGLLEAAGEESCQLISLATKKRTFWDNLLHKSTTEGVLDRLTKQALLVIHT
jgi:nucleotide-binding universal stress UspA family protein